jgi:hypothetical protein
LALGVASRSSSSSLLLLEVLRDVVFLRLEAGVDLVEAVALVGVVKPVLPLLEVELLRDSLLIFW